MSRAVRSAVAIGVACAGSLVGAVAASEDSTHDSDFSGRGWSVVRIDVDVHLRPERGELSTEGVVTLALTDADRSYGPILLLSTHRTDAGEPAIAFERVECSGATTSVLPDALADRWQQAAVRFDEAKARGSTIDVRFACRSRGAARRMIVHPSAAMADWLSAWLPFTLVVEPETLTIAPGLFRAPGRTTLHLPPGWSGLVDGDRVERRKTADGVIETWRTPEGIARGFVAGPYEIVTKKVGGREIRVYRLDSITTEAAERVAERLGQAIAAQEEKLGTFPVRGAYSIVDFPRLPEQSFGAVSEQTHILVQPPNLEYATDNIQVFAHEASHAWWGNAIGAEGPGSKWCSESLAELGALIAIERLDGRSVLHRFLDFGAPGTDPYYCGSGYFATMRQGNDQAIATMGGGPGTHALANSKGVWIFHMLRAELGDDAFFGVLRGVIRDFTGRNFGADTLRARFVSAAPDHDLERFFAQWLDRTGAPVLDADWHANVDGTGIVIELRQLQDEEPFALSLEIGIDLVDGSSVTRRVEVGEARHVFELPTPARPVGLRLDPDHELLIWRPDYGPPPVMDGDTESSIVPDEILRAVVGSYRFTGMEKDVEVFERDGSVYMQPNGSVSYRLIHERDGLFRVDAPGGMTAEFDLSTTPCKSFVSIEGGGRERYPALRRTKQ